jgi:DNA-binding PadR family transcriptional regulator
LAHPRRRRRSVTTRLLLRAQSDVEFLLGQGGSLIERSTFGSMLERVSLYATDENGKAIPPPPDDAIRIKHHHEEPGYDLDFETMRRLGRASSYLDAVGSQSRLLRATLEAYHGDRGARWARPYLQDNSGGVGDRDVAIYPLTEMGRKWVRELRKRYPLSGALQPDEVLAHEFARHKQTPTDDMRKARLRHCAVQARALLEEASRVLELVALEKARERSAIKAASKVLEALWERPLVTQTSQVGTLVLVRTSSGHALHGPYPGLDVAAWNDVGRGCAVEVVA